jgi:hypothetical protein
MTHTYSASPTAPAGIDPGARLAFVLLRTVCTVAPIAFGLDKFLGLLTDWRAYLAPWIDGIVPGTAHQAMLAVGVVEIAVGLVVALRPALSGLVVAGWLLAIIVNLVTMGEYLDVALRDFGLLVGAVALSRLATSPVASTASAGTGEDAQ